MTDDLRFSATFRIDNPSDDALGALFGGAPPGYQITWDIPARRRTIREWLTRKPRHLARRIVIPNAQLVEGPRDV